MRLDDRLRNRESDPEAVRFGRDEWCEQRAVNLRRQTASSVAHRDATSAALTSVLMVTRRRAGGVSVIASMAFISRFTITCCKSTSSPVMMQGLRRQIDGGLDLPRSSCRERRAQDSHG